MLGYFLYLLVLVVSSFLVLRNSKERIFVYPLVWLFFWPGILCGAMLFSFRFFRIITLWSWGIFLAGPIVAAVCAYFAWPRFKPVSLICGSFAVIVASIGVYGFIIEPTNLVVRRETMSSPKVGRPLRLAVLSDIQTDMVGAFEERVLRRCLAEKPDLIIFPGDYIQQEPDRLWQEVDKLHSLFARVGLDAPLGVYACRGDQDGYAGWQRIFDGLPVHVSEESTTIDGKELTVTILSRPDSSTLVYRAPPTEKFHIMFGHCPDFFLQNPEADLLIAGHTHGGQVQVPGMGPLLTYSHIDRKMAGGCFVKRETGPYMLISRGIGMERGEAPRVRFFCRPEIIIVDVNPVR